MRGVVRVRAPFDERLGRRGAGDLVGEPIFIAGFTTPIKSYFFLRDHASVRTKARFISVSDRIFHVAKGSAHTINRLQYYSSGERWYVKLKYMINAISFSIRCAPLR